MSGKSSEEIVLRIKWIGNVTNTGRLCRMRTKSWILKFGNMKITGRVCWTFLDSRENQEKKWKHSTDNPFREFCYKGEEKWSTRRGILVQEKVLQNGMILSMLDYWWNWSGRRGNSVTIVKEEWFQA
jgi:hypothetical protein